MKPFLLHLVATAAGLAPFLLIAAWIYPHQSVLLVYAGATLCTAIVHWSDERRDRVRRDRQRRRRY